MTDADVLSFLVIFEDLPRAVAWASLLCRRQRKKTRINP